MTEAKHSPILTQIQQKRGENERTVPFILPLAVVGGFMMNQNCSNKNLTLISAPMSEAEL